MVFVGKGFIIAEGGLSHMLQHPIGAMLRSNLQLPADVVLHQFAEERIVFVQHQIIVPNAGADENFLYLGKFSQGAEQIQIFFVRDFQCLARFGGQAFSVFAHGFFVAGGKAEVCGRTSHVVNISLKVGGFGDLHCFFDDGFLAS